MEFVYAFLWSHTKRSYSIFRFNFQNVIWWWQFLWSEGWTPLLTTKFGWSVNIRSMQAEEVRSRWVGWDINWCKPWIVVKEWILEPSYVVISSKHQDLDRPLKSPSITKKDDFNCFTLFSSLSKLVNNSLNSLLF